MIPTSIPRIVLGAAGAAALAGSAAADIVFVNAGTILPDFLQTGATWATAFDDLQEGLTAATAGDEIWVAEGTYKPTSGLSRTATFFMEDGVRILGGFLPGALFETQRDPVANPTILSGDIGTPILTTDNSFHVVFATGVDAAGELDGFIVEDGNANGASPDNLGGGIKVTSSQCVFRNCVIRDCNATIGGGLGCGGNSTVGFINCTFIDNSAGTSAGADVQSATPSFIGCLFADNFSTSSAGGLRFLNCNDGEVINCSFVANECPSSQGGGLQVTNADISILHSTFVGNLAGNAAGGVVLGNGSDVFMQNCILVDNTGVGTTQAQQITLLPGSTGDIDFCCIEGLSGPGVGGTGNFNADPQFVDANGADNFLGTLDDNLQLRSTSPCVDAGTSGVLPTDPFDIDGDGLTLETIDIDALGVNRSIDDLVNNTGAGFAPFNDLGPFEFAREEVVWLVDKDATGDNHGFTWEHAFTSLQSALAAANDPKFGGPAEIWVAQGTYKPTTGADRNVAFELVDGATILGGFVGGEASRAQRDYDANLTILSGDIGVPGSVTDNSFNVVRCDDFFIDDDTSVDGFVITGGNANGGPGPSAGGGVRITNGAGPVFRNCRIIGNRGNQGGGAFLSAEAVSDFVNCTFAGNVSTNAGGAGLMVITGSFAEIRNCTIVNNESLLNSSGAGLLVANAGIVDVRNTILFGNEDQSGADQAAQAFLNASSGTFNHCVIQCFGGGLSGANNTGENPAFVDPLGPDGVAGTLDDDLRLSAGSACIDSGDNSAVPLDSTDVDDDNVTIEQLPFDAAVNARILNDPGMPGGLVVDRGAFEFTGASDGPVNHSDINQDGIVDGADLGLLLLNFNTTGPTGDLNFNCFVDGADLGILLLNWTF
jgi:hypothetical protein